METKTTISTLKWPITDSGIIQDAIENFVAAKFPFVLDIGRFVDNINYRRPGKPEDGSTGFIAFDVSSEKPRLKMKTARYLTRRCGLNDILSDTYIRELAEEINRLLWTDDELNDIELVNGNKITQAYKEAVGGDSCMTGSCADYTRLYEANPERFQMLIVHNNADSARAIIHKLDNGQFLMGCIYATAEHLFEIMNNYAKMSNWFNYNNSSLSGVPSDVLVMSNLNFENGEIPYMDALTHGEIINGLLTVSARGGSFDLQNQDGTLNGDYHCDNCGDYVYEDDACSNDDGEVFCEYCYNDLYFWCGCCENSALIKSQIYIADEKVHVCENCADKHYHKCDICGKYNSLDECAGVQNDMLCMGCYNELATICGDCGDPYYKKDLTEIGDDRFCDGCIDDHQDEDKEENESENEMETQCKNS